MLAEKYNYRLPIHTVGERVGEVVLKGLGLATLKGGMPETRDYWKYLLHSGASILLPYQRSALLSYSASLCAFQALREVC